MSREEYQIPTAAGSSQAASGAGGGAGAGQGAGAGGSSARMPSSNPIFYNCGDCGFKFEMKPEDLKRDTGPLRCIECGCRILYKSRTNRMIEFEAR